MNKNPIIIRPSGVWDTRSPLFQFVRYHQKENQTYWSLILALSFVSKNWEKQNGQDSLRSIFGEKNKNDTEALRAFRESFPGKLDIKKIDPTISQAIDSINNSVSVITEYAIVSYCDIFESFLQCWTLNYLLAKLEMNIGWNQAEKNLAFNFSPIKNHHIPGTSNILSALPEVSEDLRLCPHIFNLKSNNTKVEAPITENLNALMTINFWREARNILVHKNAVISNTFYNKYKSFWEDFKQVYPHIPDFMEGRRLSLDHNVFRAMTTVHYRAAKSLRELLVKISSAKRGHVLAPNPEAPGGKIDISLAPKVPPKMLLYGDHEPSFLWTIDSEFRSNYLSAIKK